MNVKTRFIPSTEKCFADEKIENKTEIKEFVVFGGETEGVQLCYEVCGNDAGGLRFEIESPIKESITLYRVEQVPVKMACYPHVTDENYLRKEPGLYPDLLLPYNPNFKPPFYTPGLNCLFLRINADGLNGGKYPLKVLVYRGNEVIADASVDVIVTDAVIPDQTLIHTQWFHCDCLANYYDAEVFSEKFWNIVENFAREAAEGGINMILTPVFTPPLDTDVGGERRTVQLVDIEKNNGHYKFGYEKFDRFVALMRDCGMKYFEINHLFTQWGAEHAPKIMATVDGRFTKIFGWETDSHGDGYVSFLREFLTDFVAHIKEIGIADKCVFHISDEPNENQLESYLKAKDSVKDLLKGFPIMDALSDVNFYDRGVVERPVACTNQIEPFLERKIDGLWAYYCCSGGSMVSNRFIAMPGARTRILGIQLYKYNIAGFLQWGYNFYNSYLSRYNINPFLDTTGDYFVPAGDTFSVYPGEGGRPYKSLHGELFTEGLHDMRVLQLCESKIGREATVALIDETYGKELTFFDYPIDNDYIFRLRKKISEILNG